MGKAYFGKGSEAYDRKASCKCQIWSQPLVRWRDTVWTTELGVMESCALKKNKWHDFKEILPIKNSCKGADNRKLQLNPSPFLFPFFISELLAAHWVT